jgi:L-alanine-DL-glutamate epimerase-like enolase superfamily enzyme
VDTARLSFDDVASSMAYVVGLAPGNHAAKGALNIALLDGAARKMGRPIYDVLGLGFSEDKHVTSFSIGIDKPDAIREKVREADRFPVLKLKVGGPDDRQNWPHSARSREQTLRVDANEAKSRETASLPEWLATDGHIEFLNNRCQPQPSQRRRVAQNEACCRRADESCWWTSRASPTLPRG